MTQQKSSTSSALRTSVISFSVFIFFLFVIILIISVMQFVQFKIADGTAVCEEFINRCVLTFDYDDGTGKKLTKNTIIGFNEINKEGIFSVKVAYRLSSDHSLKEYFILGSPNHVFLGTKNMVIIYSLLTVFSLIICLSFIPFKGRK